MGKTLPSNEDVAGVLDRVADLLAAKGENPFRVRSYRVAADSIRGTKRSVAKILTDEGVDGLHDLKGVGERLAGLIDEFVRKGTIELLQTLEQEVPEEKVRKAALKEPKHVFANPIAIDVDIVLAVDEEYRTKAAAGKLPKIAPKKLNPEKEAWLPILNTERKGYRFTVMFSNTPQAHQLGKTADWVVVYYEKGTGENQCTVVTETKGALKGRRVIRGREAECAKHYTG
jgi:DNA polymerase (family X)